MHQLPKEALEGTEAILKLFSEKQVSTEIDALKAFSTGKGNTSGVNPPSSILPLNYAQQSLIHESFSLLPRSDDGIFTWDSKLMSHAFSNVVQLVQGIPPIADQTSETQFLLRAGQWELARAYYLVFYWFSTIGPQLVSTLINQVQTGYQGIAVPTSLEQLADHICRYVRAGKDKRKGMLLFYSLLANLS